MINYRITNNFNSSEKLYWNNEYGWTSIEEADVFSQYEFQIFNLPIGGSWELIEG